MPRNAVTFDAAELEVAGGVEQRGLPMGQTMQTMRTVVPLMPVVQEIVVEQRGTYQCALIDPVPQMHPVRQPDAEAGDPDGMGESRHRPMLVTGTLDAHMLVQDDFLALTLDDALDLDSIEHIRPKNPAL